MRAQVERRVEHRLLPHPYAVLHHRVDGAAHRAVRAHRALDLDLAGRFVGSLGLADHVERQLAGERARAGGDAGALQEGAAVDRLRQHPGEAARKAAVAGRELSGGSSGFPGEHHGHASSGQTFAVL